jgi:hypothetical protein
VLLIWLDNSEISPLNFIDFVSLLIPRITKPLVPDEECWYFGVIPSSFNTVSA